MQGKADNLEAFAKRVITKLRVGGATDSLERLLCRLMTGKDLKVASGVAVKVVEWRYGKAAQPVTGQDGDAIKVLVEHIGTQDKASAKTD